MDEPETAAAIDAAAARWVARIDGAPAGGGVRPELDVWLAGDRRRRGALLRAQAAWATLDAQTQPIAVTGRWLSRRALVAGGVGVAALGLGGIGWRLGRGEAVLATAIGERSSRRLGDGSLALLNTASRIRVAIDEGRRRVTIDKGEAWFAVAKDRSRPFVVAAGAVRIEAVGTAFSVRRHADRTDVVVTEGTVRIWSVERPARFLLATAGHRATVAEASGVDMRGVQTGGVEDALAWRRGEIVLDGMSLGDAAAEFNRYNRQTLAVDAQLSETRLVGRFRVDGIDSFATAAAAASGGRVERDGDIIRIAR